MYITQTTAIDLSLI